MTTIAGTTLQDRQRVSRAFALLSLCIGIGLLVGGGYFMHRLHLDEFVLHPEPSEGIVVRNAPVSGRGTSYAAIVAFKDSAGRPVTFRDPMAFGRPSFGEGQQVRVFHDPTNPASAMVDRGLKNYTIPAICLVVAGLCILGGLQRMAWVTNR